MISFGGKIPDNKVVCLERQCLKSDSEVVLDDDEGQGKKKRVLTGVRWTGETVRTKNRRTYYDEATLKLGPREKKVVPGQYLLITPDEEEHQSVPHYPCRVLSLYTMTWQGRLRNMAHVQWFARGENTILGRTSDPREWFMVEECEDVFFENFSSEASSVFQSKISTSGKSSAGLELQS